jgi:Arc/MetJ family transcription regulator
MRTTFALDDELRAKARGLTGLTEKSAIVRETLKALIERESARRLLFWAAANMKLRSRHAGARNRHDLVDSCVWVDHFQVPTRLSRNCLGPAESGAPLCYWRSGAGEAAATDRNPGLSTGSTPGEGRYGFGGVRFYRTAGVVRIRNRSRRRPFAGFDQAYPRGFFVDPGPTVVACR